MTWGEYYNNMKKTALAKGDTGTALKIDQTMKRLGSRVLSEPMGSVDRPGPKVGLKNMFGMTAVSESKLRKKFNSLCDSIYSTVYNSYPFLDENERAYIAGKILNRYLEDYTPGTNDASKKAPPPASTTGVGASGPLSQSGASQLVNQVSNEMGRPVSAEEIRRSQEALQKAGADPGVLRATFAAQQGLAEAIFGGETPPQVMAAKPAPDPTAKFRDAFSRIDALAGQMAGEMPNGYVNGMLSPAVITGVAKNLPAPLRRYYSAWRASKTRGM